jgi:DNA polymerase III gamma/tau subunit
VILTEQQRKRAVELAEKFDVAALIYNIATLQKLRWAVKNSDTSRALLEASLLRFALSEHFLNIDELLSQLKGGPAATISSPGKTPMTAEGKKKVQSSVNSPPKEEIQPSDDQPKNTNQEYRAPDNEQKQPEHTRRRSMISSQKRNEILNDPAVKTVLMGLDATITGIEEEECEY